MGADGQEELTAHGLTQVTELVGCAPGMVAEVLLEGVDGRLGKLAQALTQAKIAWRQAPRRALVALAGPEARAAAARLAPFPYVDLEEVAGAVPERGFVVAVDSVTDPGNLGALLRSARFFGAAGAILPEHNCVGVTPTVIRRSAGAVLGMRLCRVGNLVRALDRCRELGLGVVGSTVGRGEPLAGASLPDRCCLVVGSEGRGLRPLVLRHCDQLVTLSGAFESLNVAAFATVFCYQFSTQKNLDKPFDGG